jgi:hypothetical protein
MRASIAEKMKHYLRIRILLMRRSDYGNCGSEVFFVVTCWSEDDVLDSVCEDEEG